MSGSNYEEVQPHQDQERLAALVGDLRDAWLVDPGLPGQQVADYLRASSFSEDTQRSTVQVGRAALAFAEHFADCMKENVAKLEARQFVIQASHKAASWLISNCFPSALADDRLSGVRTLMLPFSDLRTPKEFLSDKVDKYCNTSIPGSEIDLVGLAEFYGVSKKDVNNVLRKDNSMLTNKYYVRKPGNPAAVEQELDPLFDQKQGLALLMLLGRKADELGIEDDLPSIEQTVKYAGVRIADHEIQPCRAQAIANLGKLFEEPFAVARAIEILSGKDARYKVLSHLIQHGSVHDLLASLDSWNIVQEQYVREENIGNKYRGNIALVFQEPQAPPAEGDYDKLRDAAEGDPDAPEGVKRAVAPQPSENLTDGQPVPTETQRAGREWLKSRRKPS